MEIVIRRLEIVQAEEIMEQKEGEGDKLMEFGFLASFFGFIILLALFVVAFTISTVASCLGSIADDLNEDKG